MQAFRKILSIAVPRGSVLLWFLALGVYVTILFTPMNPGLQVLIQKALFVIVALSVTLVVTRVAEAAVRSYGARVRGALPSISLFTNLTRLLVFLIGVLVILQALGIAITPILTALGVGGLAVALALEDTLANLFAGIHILASRLIRVGDYIRLESGEEGYVTDITWRNTTVRERPDNLIIVPNAKLASAVVTNFDRPGKQIAVPVELGVSHESDLDRVEEVTLEVAQQVMRESPGGVAGFAPYLRFRAFDDSRISFTVTMRAKDLAARELVRHEFVRRVLQAYRREGIEVPSPAATIIVRDGPAHVKVPSR